MRSRKKAEGLSLQVIVIAAIALVVLLVVLGVFKGGIDRIIPGLSHINDCKAKNGYCAKFGGCASVETEVYGLGCELEKNPDSNLKNPVCCIKPK
ncbi:hypothetical protein HYU40_00575 [Candidatus Woesearchaeota archaeon]|nr:hypothetical protein [Candidatus Woesearchaeota archaeon]